MARWQVNVRDFVFNMIEEIWKDIPEYEGLYQASNLGRIKRLKGVVRIGRGNTRVLPERICKPSQLKNGYLSVRLSKNGVEKTMYVHRIIASVFIPNPNCLSQVNHRDECITNNVASNLEWCTQQYNLTYGTRVHRVRQRLCRPVKCCSKDGVVISVYDGISDAVRFLNLPKTAIPNIIGCCNGNKRTAYGYKWEYAVSK